MLYDMGTRDSAVVKLIADCRNGVLQAANVSQVRLLVLVAACVGRCEGSVLHLSCFLLF